MSAPPVSYWLETAGDLTPRPPLEGRAEADVAILGAGFTGLWTAYYLLQRDPSLRVVVCEAEIAGYGASGRNGGWCSASLAVTPRELARRTSPDTARRTMAALRDTVLEVENVCAAEGIDAAIRRGGVLRVARGRHEVPALLGAWRQRVELGLDDGCALLDAAAVAQRVRVHRAEAGLFEPAAATVHPGRLVRGLARTVERLGARLHERSAVTEVLPASPGGSGPRLRTARGEVTAGTVVLAGEAWLARLRGLRRAVMPLYSLIVLTEPLSARQWRAVGWNGHECLSSMRYTVDYLSRTDDGRILFGGRGAPYHFASRIEPAFDRHEPTHTLLREQLVDWFPDLDGVRFSHAWGGAVAMPRDWMPTVRHDRRTGIAGAWGYTGQGVATANLAGRTLADLITATPSPLTELPLVDHRSPRWEPEPLRWLAARYLQGALARIDGRGRASGRAPSGKSLPERLIRH